ncbi:ROK family protein [Levilactobacillus tujiorum]|uniref:ROK family protein n=1 Tax=Levilactobacillus tujiorum TaxID=2912243 RepID=UPI00145684CB|nr:ROK family protein [Levilactobacillus tujiorum]NLR31775.1 ROK family protein [Levilactobacillus tujiorum]
MRVNPEPLLVIDIGGTTVKYGVWLHQQLLHKDRFKTPDNRSDLLAAIVELKARLQLPFVGVAISLPGSVDTVAGRISGTSAVDYLNDFPIKATLQAALGLPVSIQNDANCAALAEVWQGNAADVTDAALLVIGTGIGGAIVMNGQLVTGKQNFTGELGYQVMNDRGETLSELASPVRMSQRYQRLARRPHSVSAREVYQAAAKGDALAQRCIHDMLTYLSRAAFNLVVSLNPQRLLIGGGISERPGFVDDVQQRVQRLLTRHGAPLTADIQACKFHNDANLIGAARQFYLENGDKPVEGAVRILVR